MINKGVIMEWIGELTLDTTSRLDTFSFLFKNYFTNKERKYFLLFAGRERGGIRIDNPPYRLIDRLNDKFNMFQEASRQISSTIGYFHL